MLMRTIKKTRFVFGAVLLAVIGYSVFYTVNQPPDVSKNNKFVKEVSFYKPKVGKDVQFAISWNTLLKKSTAEDKSNFNIEQVKPDGRSWVTVNGGKKFTINNIQYVYAPWLDTEEKRSKADASERENKVTEIFVNIDPPEEINDYYKVTVNNIENKVGEKMENEEFAIVKLDKFNNLIRR
jgi:hypothetical protein